MKEMLLGDIEATLEYLSTTDFSHIYECIDDSENIYIIYTGLAQENMAEELKKILSVIE